MAHHVESASRVQARPAVPSDDDIRQAVSDLNYAMQIHLMESLRDARIASGRDSDYIAKVLGIDPAVVRDIEAGEYELSLSELQEYAYAIDAVLSYRVQPHAAERFREAYLRLIARQAGDHLWVETPDRSDDLVNAAISRSRTRPLEA